MNETSRRGCPRSPITSAAPTAPTPPAANTRPSERAEACRSFLTTYGSRTSVGPRNARYASAAESSVPQSQTRRRTNRSPALSAAHAGSGSSVRTRGGRIASTAAPGGPPRVCGEHNLPRVEPVGDDPAGKEERDRRNGHPDADDRERRRRVPQDVRLPGDRDEEDAVAEERDRHARPEQTEVTVLKRREEVDGGEPAGAVERLVTMLHRTRQRSRRPGIRRAPSDPGRGRRGSPGRARTRGFAARRSARVARPPRRRRRASGCRRVRRSPQ